MQTFLWIHLQENLFVIQIDCIVEYLLRACAKTFAYLSFRRSAFLLRKFSTKIWRSSACCSWSLESCWVKSATVKEQIIRNVPHHVHAQIKIKRESKHHCVSFFIKQMISNPFHYSEHFIHTSIVWSQKMTPAHWIHINTTNYQLFWRSFRSSNRRCT